MVSSKIKSIFNMSSIMIMALRKKYWYFLNVFFSSSSDFRFLELLQRESTLLGLSFCTLENLKTPIPKKHYIISTFYAICARTKKTNRPPTYSCLVWGNILISRDLFIIYLQLQYYFDFTNFYFKIANWFWNRENLIFFWVKFYPMDLGLLVW